MPCRNLRNLLLGVTALLVLPPSLAAGDGAAAAGHGAAAARQGTHEGTARLSLAGGDGAATRTPQHQPLGAAAAPPIAMGVNGHPFAQPNYNTGSNVVASGTSSGISFAQQFDELEALAPTGSGTPFYYRFDLSCGWMLGLADGPKKPANATRGKTSHGPLSHQVTVLIQICSKIHKITAVINHV
jgi:hypothetical protein